MPSETEPMNMPSDITPNWAQWFEWPTDPAFQPTERERSIMDEVQAYLSAGDIPEATRSLFQFEPERRESFPYLSQELSIFLNAGQWEAVRIVAEKILTTGVEFFPARFYLPIALHHLGQPEESERALALLIALHSTNPIAHFAVAYMLVAKGKHEQAAKYFELTIQMVRNDPRQPKFERERAALVACRQGLQDNVLTPIRPTIERLYQTFNPEKPELN